MKRNDEKYRPLSFREKTEIAMDLEAIERQREQMKNYKVGWFDYIWLIIFGVIFLGIGILIIMQIIETIF